MHRLAGGGGGGGGGTRNRSKANVPALFSAQALNGVIGAMDIMLMVGASKFQATRIFLAIEKGEHTTMDDCLYFKAKQFRRATRSTRRQSARDEHCTTCATDRMQRAAPMSRSAVCVSAWVWVWSMHSHHAT